MWSSRAKARPGALAALFLCLAGALAACTVAPLHAERAAGPVSLRYAEPSSRLEQVFYQTLSARLGPAAPADAPLFSVSLALSDTRLGLAAVASPLEDRQLTVQASYSVTRDDALVVQGHRTATARYQTTGQLLADTRARSEAEERATRAVAETVGLALLAGFSSP